jgi:hypothetical protein
MTWAQTCDPTRILPPEPWLPVYHVHGLAPCNGPVVAELRGYLFPGEIVIMSQIRRPDGLPFFPGQALTCPGCGHALSAGELGYV